MEPVAGRVYVNTEDAQPIDQMIEQKIEPGKALRQDNGVSLISHVAPY
jgi:hypothetical protein